MTPFVGINRRPPPLLPLAILLLLPIISHAKPLTNPALSAQVRDAKAMAVVLPDIWMFVVDGQNHSDYHAAWSREAAKAVREAIKDLIGEHPPVATLLVPANDEDPELSAEHSGAGLGDTLGETRNLFRMIASGQVWRQEGGKACTPAGGSVLDASVGDESKLLAPWLHADLLLLVTGYSYVASREREGTFFRQRNTDFRSRVSVGLVAVKTGQVLWFDTLVWESGAVLKDYSFNRASLRPMISWLMSDLDDARSSAPRAP